jgi:hypothetical protein
VKKSFKDLKIFEDWFRTKLFEEKKRRVNLIESIWNDLNLENRDMLIEFLCNDFLSNHKQFFIEKKYGDFYLVLKDQFELCYELIYEWSSLKLKSFDIYNQD